MTSDSLARVYQLAAERREEMLEPLFTMLRLPVISAQNVNLEEGAALLRGYVSEAGFATRILRVGDNPVVYGEVRSRQPNRKTILIYGHYDVQPPEPLDAWTSPPFEPVIRDGRIWARGVGDNKGQLWAHVCAVKLLREVTGDVPVNVRLIFEGQEESASPHLHKLVTEHRDLLGADFALTADGPIDTTGRPFVVFGIRGILKVGLRAKGASRDLHSGNWGGLVPSAAMKLARFLTQLKTEDGTITIPGFYDAVRPMTDKDRAALAKIPYDEARILRELAMDAFDSPADQTALEKLLFRPTLNVAGISGGYTGSGFKTVIPSQAVAKIDMRLVADQEPDDIWEKFVAHAKKLAPDVEVERLGHYDPSRTPLENPYADLVMASVRQAWGAEPIVYPSLGGSTPDAIFTKGLGIPSILVPYANHDERNHAPNENLSLACFVNGIKTTATILTNLGQRA